GAPGEPYDFWVPFMSIPSVIAMEIATIPAATPYLSADAAAQARWKARLDNVARGRRKIGIVWSGNPTFRNDRYPSMPAAALAPLGGVSDVAWFSLQKIPLTTPPFALNDFTAELHDFADTAALVANLDQVIAVDTGVAHLAGALARPL